MVPPTASAAPKLGKYELVKEQAGSSVASTWIARVPNDAGKLYAIQRVHRHVTKKVETAQGLLDEAKRALILKHPNVVPFVEVGVNDGEVFLVTEHVEGELLSTLVTSAGPKGIPQPIAARIGLDVLDALRAAHALGEAHGELGPHHVRVGIDGVSRIIGFGSARALAKMGTHGVKNHERLAYASPERVKVMAAPAAAAVAVIEPSADVFSVGVVLWELLTHQRLFSSKIEAAVIQKVLTASIAKLSTVAGVEVPADVDAAVAKALVRDPAERAEDVKKLQAALDSLSPASPEEVAEYVEKLAGKQIAARKQEIASALSRPNGALSSIPPAPAPLKVSSRKQTLMGFAPAGAEAVKEAVAKAKEASAKEAAAKEAAKPAPPAKSAPAAEARAAAVSLGDDLVVDVDEEPSAKPAPPPPPPAPPAAGPRPPPPPRKAQHTLLGHAPIGTLEESAPAKEAPARPEPPRKPPPPARTVTSPAPGKVDRKSAEPKVAEPKEEPKPVEAKAAEAEAPQPPPEEEVATQVAPPPPAEPSATPDSLSDPAKRVRGPAASALEKIAPGSTLGRYEVLQRIAMGGMASVWAGRIQGTRGFQRLVAIKTMLPDLSDDAEFQTMFLDEAKVAARIRHPNVCQILDLGEQDEVLYLVMDWIDGETLSTLQKAAKPLGGIPLAIALRIASQALSGLHTAHEQKDDAGNLIDLVHRDISPGNILVSTSGFAKIVDFGIAKSKERIHVTHVGGMVKGKTPYLSPEQLGSLPLDRRSDIFSFGVLLYVLVTGVHPFRGESEMKTIENIAYKTPTSLRELNPAVSPELDKLVLKALEKEASKRFATAAEMQKALEGIAASLGEPTTDEDVAEFVKKAVGEHQAKRAAAIRAAIAQLDADKPVESRSTARRAADIVSPEVAAAAAAALEAPAAEEPVAPAPAELPAKAAADSLPAIDDRPPPAQPSFSDLDDDLPMARPPRPYLKPIAIGAVVACLLLAVGALLFGGKSPPTVAHASPSASAPPTAPAEAPTAAAAAPAPPPQEPAAAPAATAAPEPAPAPPPPAEAEAPAAAPEPAANKPAPRGGGRPQAAKPRGKPASKPVKKYNPSGI